MGVDLSLIYETLLLLYSSGIHSVSYRYTISTTYIEMSKLRKNDSLKGYMRNQEAKNPYYIGNGSAKLHFEKLEEREDQQESEQSP